MDRSGKPSWRARLRLVGGAVGAERWRPRRSSPRRSPLRRRRSLVQGSAERRVTAGRRCGERRGHRAAGRRDDRGAVGQRRPRDAAARRQRRQGVRPDPGRPRRLLRAAGRRGPRARRRERLRQVDGGQDPERRPHPGRRRDRARAASTSRRSGRRARRRAAASSRSSRRCSSPSRARCSTTSGSAPTSTWRTRVSPREKRARAQADARRAARPRARPEHGRRGALAVGPPGVRDRARARCATPRS